MAAELHPCNFHFFLKNLKSMRVDNKVQTTIAAEVRIVDESIDFFVRMMSILGLPRSVGEIYGILYFSESPLSMDEISSRLKISMGSTSQGLKTLRSLKAIRTTYVQGDRKDHYVAETEFRRLFSNFIKEDILPQEKRSGVWQGVEFGPRISNFELWFRWIAVITILFSFLYKFYWA